MPTSAGSVRVSSRGSLQLVCRTPTAIHDQGEARELPESLPARGGLARTKPCLSSLADVAERRTNDSLLPGPAWLLRRATGPAALSTGRCAPVVDGAGRPDLALAVRHRDVGTCERECSGGVLRKSAPRFDRARPSPTGGNVI